MNKKHICLFATLFLMSTLISATMVVAFADTQQSTAITYTSLSPEEKNNYTINIPSTLQITGDSTPLNISVEDGYSLESDYRVTVTITEDSFTNYDAALGEQNPYDSNNLIRLYLDGDTNSSYYYSLATKNSANKYLNAWNPYVFRFTSNGIDSSMDGALSLTKFENGSTDKNYKEAGNFTGTITFNIYGEYF